MLEKVDLGKKTKKKAYKRLMPVLRDRAVRLPKGLLGRPSPGDNPLRGLGRVR